MTPDPSPPPIEVFDPGAVGKACVECGRPAWRTLLDSALCLDHYANRTMHIEPLDLGAKTKRTLREAVETVRRWHYLPDAGRLMVPLAAVIANLYESDPVWLLEVAASSSGKTEVITPLGGLPYAHLVSSLTEASLLSGTPRKEQTKGATGGLLRQIGDFGIILVKDFSAILALRPEQKASVLAALREIYDGYWSRALGTDGGRVESWRGKIGFLGAVTPAIDKHHSVMGSLGERFLLYRPAAPDSLELSRQRLDNVHREITMREELAAAIISVIDASKLHAPDFEAIGRERLAVLATYVAAARTAVERDTYHRDLEAIPQAERGGRLVVQLGLLANGLLDIGADPFDMWRLIRDVGWGCVPEMRRRLLHVLRVNAGGRTSDLAEATGMAHRTADLALDDLRLLGLVTASRVAGDQRGTRFYVLNDEAYEWPA